MPTHTPKQSRERFLVRRFSGRAQTRHVEMQLIERDATRRVAVQRAAQLSRQYPRDAVLLFRDDRAMLCFRNGDGVRVTAAQREKWERTSILRASLSDETPRSRIEQLFQRTRKS